METGRRRIVQRKDGLVLPWSEAFAARSDMHAGFLVLHDDKPSEIVLDKTTAQPLEETSLSRLRYENTALKAEVKQLKMALAQFTNETGSSGPTLNLGTLEEGEVPLPPVPDEIPILRGDGSDVPPEEPIEFQPEEQPIPGDDEGNPASAAKSEAELSEMTKPQLNLYILDLTDEPPAARLNKTELVALALEAQRASGKTE